MRRTSEFDKSKLLQVATNKTVMNVYVDSFPIEMVKIKFQEFEGAKNAIDIYLSFSDALRVTQDIKSGKIFKDMQGSKYPIVISRGGTPAARSSRADKKAESRQLTFGMTEDKVYINASAGPGKESSTGAIIPDGQPDKKISVGMSLDDFKGTFLYIEAGINAYMPFLIKELLKAVPERTKD